MEDYNYGTWEDYVTLPDTATQSTETKNDFNIQQAILGAAGVEVRQVDATTSHLDQLNTLHTRVGSPYVDPGYKGIRH